MVIIMYLHNGVNNSKIILLLYPIQIISDVLQLYNV